MTIKPNIILILNDDMGYSDIGCYGGEVQTPNLDKLATDGVRYTQFYNTARCSPSRASLLTGLHPHQTGIGVLVNNDGPEGYAGSINEKCVTIAEVLKGDGYRTYMSGKWHITNSPYQEADSWPTKRGFDRHYGIHQGATDFFYPIELHEDGKLIDEEPKNDPDYYFTDAISDKAVTYLQDHRKNNPDHPYFMYVAYTAPHWPLHAKEADIAKYKGRFDAGWDQLRKERLKRLQEKGILDSKWKLSDRDPTQLPWDLAENKEWEAGRMEAYAAQIDIMDQGIGRILKEVESQGQMENTVIIFLSDNGGCAEPLMPIMKKIKGFNSGRRVTREGKDIRFGNLPTIRPGASDTYSSYGIAWANLSNTPFRKYKHWAHEGGIATPLIIHWPKGVQTNGQICHQAGQLPDIMATILDITKATYPEEYQGKKILPPEGTSLTATFKDTTPKDRMLFFEHEGNAAVRQGKWKMVRDYPKPWELYDMEADRTELTDLSAQNPEKMKELQTAYKDWANRCGVVPWERYTKKVMGFVMRMAMKIMGSNKKKIKKVQAKIKKAGLKAESR